MESHSNLSQKLIDSEAEVGVASRKIDLPIENLKENEREGITNAKAEELYLIHGYNALPVIEIPLWYVFIQQFMGTMPYMLELAIIIAAAVQDWIDLGIILAMVCTYTREYLI